MQKFFQRIWQWIQQLFAPLVGGPGPRSKFLQELPPLSDTDYEFLFNQLLEGIAHGWHEGRILKFFQQLDHRCRPKQWLDWLDRFQTTVLASPSPNLVLAARMMRLGELAQSFPQIAPIGDKSQRIGRELYARQSPPQMDTVWEYDGPDLVSVEQAQAEGEMESFTFDELVQRLPHDPALVAHFAGFLGIESTDPQVILQGLMEKFNIPADMLVEAVNKTTDQDSVPVEPVETAEITESFDSATEQLTANNGGGAESEYGQGTQPHSPEDWFNLGIQQAQRGELEEAIASWGEAINLNPDMTAAWQNRGSALGVMGKLAEALINFDEALAQNPNDAEVWLSRGLLLEAMERQAEAIPSYEKALALQPTIAEAQERLSHLKTPPQDG
ncbi:tetratricopeptide repeat protein [Synechocystis sp. LEGE 06083]|uniref:tetratricopeptide repeat protein n=1 Tax=Synechocystis sp. LEGE 06083 TaxID=915336 RepID=UPI001880CEA0|nr:tetratricopeptide repeat protein [Synechocystis sp. LEGE 06083]MBE9196764.1 tetratricopeptide repeat protein [Synechocystis sp. LEGE 06083]